MKRSILILIAFAIGILAWLFLNPIVAVPSTSMRSGTVTIAGKTLTVAVVDTNPARERGLSGTKKITDDQGMLFVFDTEDTYAFWMKDMLFPLDIIWLSSDLHIVYIQKNATPASYPTAFTPTAPARYVLEVNAGFSEKNNVHIGDQVNMLMK